MGKLINYKGKKFNRLTVISDPIRRNGKIFYLCQCECGNTKEIRIDHLKNGDTQSCGCLQKERASQKLTQDLTGNRYGKLVVLERDFSKKSKRGAYWICKCDCGNIVSVCSIDLKTKSTQSCGCLQDEIRHKKMIDLTGQIFNYLQVVSLDEERTKQEKATYWFCKCLKCNQNKIKSIKGSHLKDGSVKSCGCLKSFYEEKIEEVLLNNNISYKREYYFNDLLGDKKKLRFDFAIFKENKLKYLIEYHGKQHYQSVDFWGGEESFKKRQYYDKLKEEYCIKNNIPLFILNENNFLLESEIIKEDILNG